MNIISAEIYTDRLVEEWLEHKKIVIAVDFDDTIFPWKHTSSKDLERYKNIIKLLQDCKKQGCYITIWSACSTDRFQEIKDYCKSMNLEIDSINENPIELPYGVHKKIYANIYLDDRAGLNESLLRLERALYIVKGKNNSQSVMDQVF